MKRSVKIRKDKIAVCHKQRRNAFDTDSRSLFSLKNFQNPSTFGGRRLVFVSLELNPSCWERACSIRPYHDSGCWSIEGEGRNSSPPKKSC
mmetsp:Transcript_31/g.33  ORF Transcript_31/g.33 Transcript_31/m.33 type:complete len:91 (-) Transcript_31:2021-2293(-)